MYQSSLKSAVCNLFSYNGLTVRNVQNWEASHGLSSGQLRYQADRNTGGRIFWIVPKWRPNLTTQLKSVEVPNSPTHKINRKYSHVLIIYFENSVEREVKLYSSIKLPSLIISNVVYYWQNALRQIFVVLYCNVLTAPLMDAPSETRYKLRVTCSTQLR